MERSGHPDFYRYTQEMDETHDVKNRDYTHGGDPLGNFKRVSSILKIWGYDIPPYLVALIYALKQQDAYMWMLSQGYEGQVEGVHPRLNDDAVYKVLTRCLLNDEQKPCT